MFSRSSSSPITAMTRPPQLPGRPHPVLVIEMRLGPDGSNAGWARKTVMDLAADRLEDAASAPAFILTTDADSCASPTWVAATLAGFDAGADCVAGYIDAQPSEIAAK